MYNLIVVLGKEYDYLKECESTCDSYCPVFYTNLFQSCPQLVVDFLFFVFFRHLDNPVICLSIPFPCR